MDAAATTITADVAGTASGVVGGSVSIYMDDGTTMSSNLVLATSSITNETVGDTAVTTTGKAGSANADDGNYVGLQDLTIVGPNGSETFSVAADTEAAGIATAVNDASASTGVTAEARTSATIQNLSENGTVTFKLQGTNSNTALVANVNGIGRSSSAFKNGTSLRSSIDTTGNIEITRC